MILFGWQISFRKFVSACIIPKVSPQINNDINLFMYHILKYHREDPCLMVFLTYKSGWVGSVSSPKDHKISLQSISREPVYVKDKWKEYLKKPESHNSCPK